MELIESSGQRIVRGKTYEHRELLKALGGYWNAGPKCWSFGPKADLTALEPLLETRPVFDGRWKARGATFLGEAYPNRDVLKALGARWDGQAWRLEKTFYKEWLEAALKNVTWRWYRPFWSDRDKRKVLVVKLDYDEELHRSLKSGCYCDETTCDPCMFACCPSAQSFDVEGGIGFDCPHHGDTVYAQ
jgi:hypothetical protein